MADAAKSSQDSSMMDVDLGNMICMASSSTQMEDPLSLSSRGTIEQLPPVSLATLHSSLQYLAPRTQTPSSALGTPPDSKFSPISENRTHHPHPSGNSPTQQGLYSPDNPI